MKLLNLNLFQTTTLTIGAWLLGISSLAAQDTQWGNLITRGQSQFPGNLSFVVSLGEHEGVKLDDLSAESSQFADQATSPWFLRVQKTKRYHAMRASGSFPYTYTEEFDNPIAAFGRSAGEYPLYTGRTYRFGVHAGFRHSGTEPDFRIQVYSKASLDSGQTGVAPVGSIDIRIPRLGTLDWFTFILNGHKLEVENYELKTTLQVINPNDLYWWGVIDGSPCILSHKISGTSQYYYVIEALGTVDKDFSDKGMVKVDSVDTSANANSILYAMEFEERPDQVTTLVETPNFDASPMPSAYQGKSLQDLLNVDGITQNFNFDLDPRGEQLVVGQSPELRSHPRLDQFVADMGSDPLALVNYVLNEIELTDPMAYNDRGQVDETSVNDGGIKRSALGVFMEEQGSPTETCALLVYLLRQAGYHAVYVHPEANQVKMLDYNLSRLLGIQLSGAQLSFGYEFRPYDEAEPSLIPVNYPWVAAYLPDDSPSATAGAKRWVQLFPWLKDMEIIEGGELYDYLPDTYDSAFDWVKKYMQNDASIISLGNADDPPSVLFPKFLEANLLANHPGVSLDDIGIQTRQRKNYFARWQDFPTPFRVEGTPDTRLDFNTSPEKFDTISVEVSLANNPSKKVVTGSMRAADIHNRKFLIYHEYDDSVGYHRMHMVLAPYHDGITDVKSFANDPTLLAKQTLTLDLNEPGETLNVKFSLTRNHFLQDDDRLFWGNNYLQLLDIMEYEQIRPINKGDFVSLCYFYGRVSERMIQSHAEEFWKMEQALDQDSTLTPDPEVAHGTMLYMMGMSYFQRVSSFQERAFSWHKTQTVGSMGINLATLEAERDSNGNLANTPVVLEKPAVDVPLGQTAVIANNSAHADQPLPKYSLLPRDEDLLAFTEGSAQEHSILNDFFGQSEALSTVRVLQLADADSANGWHELTSSNYTSYQSLIESSSPSTWESVRDLFQSDPNHAVVWIPQQQVVTTDNTLFGAFGISRDSYFALINNLNGGVGEKFPQGSMALNNGVGFRLRPTLEGGTELVFVDGQGWAHSVRTDGRNIFGGIPTWAAKEMEVYLTNNPLAAYNPYAVAQINTYTDFNVTASTAETFVAVHEKGNFAIASHAENMTMNWIADPFNSMSGEFYQDEVDLRLNGPMPLEVRRNYLSQNLADGEFGQGWKLNYVPYLTINSDETLITAVEMTGSVIVYRRDGTSDIWRPTETDNPAMSNQSADTPGSVFNKFNNRIERSTDGSLYSLLGADGSIRSFAVRSFPTDTITRQRPYLNQWKDAHGNFYTFEYGESAYGNDYGRIRRVQSSNGNFLGFYYDIYGHITEIYTGDGRHLYYEYDSFGDLIKVTRPDNSVIEYEYQHDTFDNEGIQQEYSEHLLTYIRKPDGRVLKNIYDTERRIVEQWATVGTDLNLVKNATVVYTHTSLPGEPLTGVTQLYDVFNRETRYEYTDGQITLTRDALNQDIVQQWYTATDVNTGAYRRALEYRIDKRGLRTDFTYDANGNVKTQVVTGDLTGTGSTTETETTTYEYNALNLVTSITTSSTGNAIKFYYEDTRFPYLPTRQEQWSGTTLVSQTTHEYDEVEETHRSAYGLKTRTVRGLGGDNSDRAISEWHYDGRGFPTQQTQFSGTSDPNVINRFAYNLRGELIEEENDATGWNVRYNYDNRGNRKWREVRDENETLIAWQYDYFNHNNEITWSDGARYDPEDYLWRKHDGFGRVIEESVWRSQAREDGTGVEQVPGDAFAATTFYTYNAFGDLKETKDPRGNVTQMDYDGIGQMTARRFYQGESTGTLLRSESFTLEPGGKVEEYTNPKGGITTTTYNDRGQPTLQSLPDGSELSWTYHLDGRPATEVLRDGGYWETVYDDPNRTVTRIRRDSTATELFREVSITGRRGNVVSRTDGESHTFTSSYDGLDRIKTATGPAATPDSAQQITTTTYDGGGQTLITTNALGESIVATFDPLGRPLTSDIKNPSNQTVRSMAYTYSANHHATTVTDGTGAEAIITTSYTDTAGRPVLVQFADGNYQRSVYDANGNVILSRDELNHQTTISYDGLNREDIRTLPDGAQIDLDYDTCSNLITRLMPGGLQWNATYDNANRMTTESLTGGGLTSRSKTYTYFTTGVHEGLLHTVSDGRGVTRTLAYDDHLRVDTVTYTGSLLDQARVLDYAYDNRSLITQIDQTGTGITSSSVIRNYDGYGQMTQEEITEGSGTVTTLTDFSMTWDGAGRRSTLNLDQSDTIASDLRLPGNDFTFAYRADELLESNTVNTETYAFTYGTQGRLISKAGPSRAQTASQRDSRGRIGAWAASVGGTTAWTEGLTYHADSRLEARSITATPIGAGTSPYAAIDSRTYSYNSRRKLTNETYFPLPEWNESADYQFDFDQPGIGVRTEQATRVGNTHSATNPTGVNSLQRTTDESSSLASRVISTDGIAIGADKLELYLDGELVDTLGRDEYDDTGTWNKDLTMDAGVRTLEARPIMPSGSAGISDTTRFQVEGDSVTLTTAYDGEGNVLTRTFGDGRTQTFTWDALGRLVRIEQRNASNNGFNWTATYDGLGRRLRSEFDTVAANVATNPQLTVDCLFDPLVEFLEIGTNINKQQTAGNSTTTWWKVYGPDSNGIYGGLNGIGGLESLIQAQGSNTYVETGIICDFLGHAIATSDGTNVQWKQTMMSGYGPLNGLNVKTLLEAELPEATAWQGRCLEPTGFYCMGTRYYEPDGGRFLSPDPLGHPATMDLYSYAQGDPINYVDPDGRFGKAALATADGIVKGFAELNDILGLGYTNAADTAIATPFASLGLYDPNEFGTAQTLGSFAPVVPPVAKVAQSSNFGSRLLTNVGKFFGLIGDAPAPSAVPTLFRGTSIAFESSTLKTLGVTPASVDPVVATAFARQSDNFGTGVVQIAQPGDLLGVEILPGNVLHNIEREIGVGIRPSQFAERAGTTISTQQAVDALQKLGISIPRIGRDPGELQSVLDNTPRLTDEQIKQFLEIIGN